MARRSLPSPQEALRILGEKRTRPQRRPPPPLGRALGKTLRELDARFGQGPGALIALLQSQGETLANTLLVQYALMLAVGALAFWIARGLPSSFGQSQ